MAEQSEVERLQKIVEGDDYYRPAAPDYMEMLIAAVRDERDREWLEAPTSDGSFNPWGDYTAEDAARGAVDTLVKHMGYEWRDGKWVKRDAG